MSDDQAIEFDCSECGRHIFQYPYGGPVTFKCAACTTIPGWHRNPDLAKRIDPNYQPKEGQ